MGDFKLLSFRTVSKDFTEQVEDNVDTETDIVVSKSRVQIYFNLWMLEVLSCLIASIALAAIIITLVVHQGRPLPQWPHLISINSLLAVFTVILKASLSLPVAEGISQLKWMWYDRPHMLIDLDQIDAASRGPWGALLLILKMPSCYLANFGALLTIVALAIDPFSQQIVLYDECQQPLDATAMVSRTNGYSQISIGALQDPVPPVAQMITALYNGLITPPENSTSLVITQCKTGNCTFPTDAGASYSSLAIGFSCQDISDQITEDDKNDSGGDDSWSLPSGANVKLGDSYSRLLDISQPKNSSRTDIFTFDVLTLTYWSSCVGGDGCIASAVRCSLFPVMNTYGANIAQDVLQEVLLETTILPYSVGDTGVLATDEHVTGQYLLVANSSLRNGMWHGCDPSENSTAENTTPAQRCVLIEDNVCKTEGPFYFYPYDCIWYFGTPTADGIGSYMYDLMIGQSLSVSGESMQANYLSGNIWIQNLYNSVSVGSVDEYMEGLSNSITAIIRQGDTSGNSTQGWAQGTVLGMQTCIQVQWAWISLPAVVLGLVVAFLRMTALQTGRSSTVWKSSSLALLFHGLSPDKRGHYGTLDRVKDLDRVAKDMQATLERTDAGWTFVEHESHDVHPQVTQLAHCDIKAAGRE